MEQTTSALDWTRLQGEILEGGYQLTEVSRLDQHSATFKVRVLGDYSLKTFANVFPATGDIAEQQLELWRAAKLLQHPNLSSPVDLGRARLNDTDLIFVIVLRPDETLSGVLRDRALTPPEATDLLRSIRSGLQALHANGFTHGCLSPDQVLAFGETIALSTHSIRTIGSLPPVASVAPNYLAPESAAQNATTEADVWCLGATIFEALTQKPCEGDCRDAASVIPEPQRTIIRNCLDPNPQARPKLDKVEEVPPPPIETPKPAPAAASVAAAAAPASSVAASPVTASPVTPAPRPIAVPQPAPPRAAAPAPETRPSYAASRPSSDPGDREAKSIRPWIYVLIGVAVVLGMLLWARPKHPDLSKVAGPKPPESKQTATTLPAPVGGTSWPTRTLTPDNNSAKTARTTPPARTTSAPAPVTAAHAPAPAANEEKNVNGSVWRVVLYTYAHQEDAAKKAAEINQKHTGLGAEVFSPGGHNHVYLVVAGGRMNRDEAVRLRRQAISFGMPHDSYIQNYKQ